VNEIELWNKLRGPLAAYGDFSRIESFVTPGYPDVDGCIAGVTFKIELKYIPSYPARSTTRIMGNKGLRTDQSAWAHRRIRHGGRLFVLVGVERDLYLFRPGLDDLYTMNDWSLTQFNQEAVFIHMAGRAQPVWGDLVDALTRIGK
jgi:hypothetical protein